MWYVTMTACHQSVK